MFTIPLGYFFMLNSSKKCIALICICLSACTQVDDFMFGKDNTPDPTPLKKLTPRTDIATNWSIPTGKMGNAQGYLKLKPAVTKERVYIASRDGLVQALNKDSGKVIWSKQLKSHFVSGPTVNNGRLALASDDSTIMLLDASDGQALWQADISSEALANPVIAQNKVFVKAIDSNVYAFDLKTGEKEWVSDHGSPSLILKASTSPVIVDKSVLVGFADGKIDALDIHSGHTLWQRNLVSMMGGSEVERLVDIDADPIADKDRIYLAGYQGVVGALSTSTGEYLWRKPASVYKNMSFDGSTLYFTDSNSVLWAVDAKKGMVKWKQKALMARDATAPVLIANQLLVGDRFGFLHLLSAESGEVISRAHAPGAIDVSPVVFGRNAYVLTTNGKLNKYTLA